jgi:Uma2 family endonuclease
MEASVKNKTQNKPKLTKGKKIPEALIFEILDGEPLYYRGYKEVLKGKKTKEEIMGSSSLQSILIEYLLRLLFKGLDETKYRIFSNEAGVHIQHKGDFSYDIAVYEKLGLTADKISKKYADVPCKLAIEIDVKIDISQAKDYDYVQRKTQKLLDFGVEKVIWLFTETQKVMTATQAEDWRTANWEKTIDLIEGLSFNIAEYLKNEGVDLKNIL